MTLFGHELRSLGDSKGVTQGNSASFDSKKMQDVQGYDWGRLVGPHCNALVSLVRPRRKPFSS